MLERAWAAEAAFAWVTADAVYGSDEALRAALEARRQPYVLGVHAHELLLSHAYGGWPLTAAEMAAAPADGWHRLSAGEGSKGPRLYDWARVPLAEPALAGWTHALLVRRSPETPTDLAYYRAFAPADTPLAALVRVVGWRWAIEEVIEQAKGEVGLDEYEVRSWTGWYRRVTLALLAHAFLVATRAAAQAAEKGGSAGREGARAAERAGDPCPPHPARAHRATPTGARPRLVSVAPPPSGGRYAVPLPTPSLLPLP